jgi:tRNA pseudouridine(38-40) synthase
VLQLFCQRTDPVALKMIIEYDGTDFSGCQLQPNLRTVQGELERCICRLTGEQPKLGACGGGSIVGTQGVEGGGIRVVFASRTDKGVHARGQVALVRTRSELAWTDPTSFAKRLSSFLPEDLAIVSAAHAEPEFEPRSNTKGKWYRYTIASGVSRPALGRHTHWFVPRPRESGDTSASADLLPPRPRPLDIPAMQRAASMLVGAPHDFTSFANVGKGAVSDGLDASSRDPVCLVDSITIKELMSNGDASSTSSAPCSMIDVDIRGSRFLFNMVSLPPISCLF